MLFERFEDPLLSHYSFVIGCPGAQVAAVIDPKRDFDDYVECAKRHRVEIRYVLETHVHADYASGARELAAATGAELLLSAYDDGEIFDVTFPHTEMRDGDRIAFGAVTIESLYTPGHTPEHICFVVYDGASSTTEPLYLLSGDFVFAGSLGRPDLLGDAHKQALAARVYDSIRGPLSKLPPGLTIYPAHGSGSL